MYFINFTIPPVHDAVPMMLCHCHRHLVAGTSGLSNNIGELVDLGLGATKCTEPLLSLSKCQLDNSALRFIQLTSFLARLSLELRNLVERIRITSWHNVHPNTQTLDMAVLTIR